MLVVIWTLAIVIAIALYFRHLYSSFKRAGVNNLPTIPPAGNLTKTTLKLEHKTETMNRIYNAFPEDRFVGHYEFMTKVVLIRDRDLLKQIVLKDFDHFTDHRLFISEDTDPIFSRTLFTMKGEKWRDMRVTLSPAFTSSKIRLMVPFMTEVGDQMMQVLRDKIEATADKYIDIDARDLTTRYANDVIGTCAFGIKTNSHADENNEFYIKGREAVDFNFIQLMKIVGFTSFPTLMKTFKITLLAESTISYFRSLISSVMRDRKERNIIRPDMIHLLMEAKKGKLKHNDEQPSENAGFATVEEVLVGKTTRVWTDDDLYSQAVFFFLAGFETVSTAMSFLLYELALNRDIQNRVVAEIKEVDAKNGGKLDFNSILQMEYLDMVVSEILRLWTPATTIERECTKDYNLGRPNDKASKDYVIKKGEGLWIPIWAIHHSEQNYPDPYKFDPERFSKQNLHKIKPFTYMPFGVGPRNCIGSRFALCEIKVMVYELLKEMEVSPCDRTTVPVELSRDTLGPRMKDGNWLRFSVRE